MIKSEMKKRNWTFVLYPDSCSPDWEDYLTSTGIPFSFAFHDKDLTELGEKKKDHYHVLICYDGPTTYNVVHELGLRCGCANGVVQPVGSVRGIVRYFCHLDNPDKYQYNENIIQYRNGFDPKDYFCLTVSQTKVFKRRITEFIRDNDINYYSELIDTLIDLDEGDMYDVASQNVFYFTQYIASRKNKEKQKSINKALIVNGKKL